VTPAVAQLGRFTIRDVNVRDTPDLYALFGNPDTVRYVGVRQLATPGEAAQLIERYQSSPTRWLSVLEGTKFLGIVGLEIRGHQAALTIASNGIRRGFGREFSVPFVQWIFTHPQIWRVWAYCHRLNFPVQRVMKRMGATQEGLLRRFEVFPNISDEPQDVYVYSITRDDMNVLSRASMQTGSHAKTDI